MPTGGACEYGELIEPIVEETHDARIVSFKESRDVFKRSFSTENASTTQKFTSLYPISP